MNHYRLKDLRKDYGLSKEVVAGYLDLDWRMYSRFEADPYDMSYRNLLKLCKLYQTSLAYLLGEEDLEYTLLPREKVVSQLDFTAYNKLLAKHNDYRHAKEKENEMGNEDAPDNQTDIF